MQKAANELKKGFDVSETGAPSAVSSRRSHQRGSDAGAAAGTATRAERRLRSSGSVDGTTRAIEPQSELTDRDGSIYGRQQHTNEENELFIYLFSWAYVSIMKSRVE
eukprot:GHVU01021970.1.p3 GENE.GHVU01021970.1~~GHVU01021970.1.p3  ORF type:complete len:107 (+),score=11.41 GHVU01021970.1:1976-2296(+)